MSAPLTFVVLYQLEDQGNFEEKKAWRSGAWPLNIAAWGQ